MVRFTQHGEAKAALFAEVLALTKKFGIEFALVQFSNGNRAIVSGNANGISFAPGEPSLIFAHTHVTNAQASVADFEAMTITNQKSV